MQITKIEFVLLVAVVSGVIIFCPESLVILRNLSIWGLFIWAAWYSFDQWESSAWLRQVMQNLLSARSLADVAGLVWGESTSAGMEWMNNKVSYTGRTCSRVWAEFYSRCRDLLGLVRGKSSSTSSDPNSSRNNQANIDSTPSSKPSTLRVPKYYVLLITTPPVHRYGEFSDEFSTPEDKPSPIPWDTTSTDSIPLLTPSLKFRRHWGVGLVKDTDWECKSLTLIEKLNRGLFWDHCGDEQRKESVCGVGWSCSCIRKINGIHNLGIIAESSDAINRCSKFYNKLRPKWDYLNIWWNDADFAIILAFLTIGDEVTSECACLLRRLAQLRYTDVTRPRGQACKTNFFAGCMGFVGGMVLTVLTGGAAAPITIPTALGSWGWAFGSGMVGVGLSVGECGRIQRRCQSCSELQARFPQLQKLFEMASKN